MCSAVVNFQQVEKKVLEYRTQLCYIINAPSVLIGMPGFLLTADEREIKAIHLQSQERAAFLLLKYISMCPQLGKWEAFLEALRRADYPYLVSLLDSNQSPEQSVHQKKILQIFAQYLELQLKPLDLISHFYSSKLINEGDMDEIQACQTSQGSVAATMLLLDRIQRRQAPSKWYTDFLKILYQKGFKEIVHEMEPEFSLDCEILKVPKLLVTDTSDSDIDTDEYGYSIEEKIEAKVKYFQSEITELVRVEKIAPALCQLIDIGKVCQIMQCRASSKKESTESLLEEIGKLRSKTKWRTFISCLKQSDYLHLAELLSKPCTRTRQNNERALLRLFYSELGTQLEPLDLISHLEKDNVINHRDREEIFRTLQRSGKTAASLVLMDCLQSRLAPAQWFSSFLKALHACGRGDLVQTLDPEYLKKQSIDDSEIEKECDLNAEKSQEANNLVDRLDAAHCHIYKLEKAAKQEVVKMQNHFDDLKKKMYKQIENKTFALTKSLENVEERSQEAGLKQKFEASLQKVMSTSYTICSIDSFTNLSKLAVIEESYGSAPLNHSHEVQKQNAKEYESKRVAIRKQGAMVNRRRRCYSESSSCSSSSSGYLCVTNSTSLSTSSDPLALGDLRGKHESKVRFANDSEIICENLGDKQLKNYLHQYAIKKSCRIRTLSGSSVLSTDTSMVSSTDREPSSSLTDSLTETSTLSSSTKNASATEKKVLFERTESYIFHHKKVVNCESNCVLSSVCVLPNNKTVLIDQRNCSFYVYGNVCEKLKCPRFKYHTPVSLCNIGENLLYILFRKRDCTTVLIQCSLNTTDVSFVKTVDISDKCIGKLCSIASGSNNIVAFCVDKHMHLFSRTGKERKVITCVMNENVWWPNYSVVDSGCAFGFTYDVYSSSVKCFCISTGKMQWSKTLEGVEGITLCGDSIYLSLNVSYEIQVLSKTTGDHERSITENVRRPFAMSRSQGHDTIIVTQYHPEGRKMNRTIKYF